MAAPTLDDINAAIAAKSAPTLDDINQAIAAKSQAASTPGVAQTALEHGANGLLLGYLPQAQAGVEAAVDKLGSWKDRALDAVGLDKYSSSDNQLRNQGFKVPQKSYVDYRDANIQRLNDEAAANPRTAMAAGLGGNVVGAVATPMPEALAAKGIIGGITKGAALGAAYGGLANPGDTQGQVDPLQLSQRGANAKSGAIIGAVTGGTTQAVSRGLGALANSPASLGTAANDQAVKASGAMLKDFRALSGANRTQAIGQFALDNGLVQAGDTYESVGAKADAFRKDAGKRLDAIYSQATDAGAKAPNLPDGVGFNPVKDKAQILSKIKDHLGDDVGASSAVNSVSNYLDELGTKYGDKVLDPKTANNIEGAVSKKINFYRNPLSASPENEQAMSSLRSILSDKVDNHIEYLGNMSGNDQTAANLAQANRDYGYAKQLGDMAKDRTQRILANNRLSLGDTIAGGSGAVAGAMVGHEVGGDSVEGGIAGMAGMALLHHYGREYGDAALASALRGGSKVMAAGPSQLAGVASSALNPNVVARGVTGYDVQNGQQAVLPQAAPAPAPTSPQVVPTDIPSKGPEKWANDGMQKLRAHSTDDDKALLDKYKDTMMADPKAKQLLTVASSYQPGSKPLDDIMKHLKKRIGEDSK